MIGEFNRHLVVVVGGCLRRQLSRSASIDSLLLLTPIIIFTREEHVSVSPTATRQDRHLAAEEEDKE